MAQPELPDKVFPSAGEDAAVARLGPQTAQTQSPSYRLAFLDEEFLLRDELRPVRLQLELLKPDLVMDEFGIHSTVVVFGSARIPDRETALRQLAEAEVVAASTPGEDAQSRLHIARRLANNSRYYEEARRLARLITTEFEEGHNCRLMVSTGGGPGIMEAANRGAHEAGGKSIGLNIVLPFEQSPNPYITPELSYQFHYFALRKMHFLKRAKALVACPGGFGTFDELFETLTLVQTGKIKALPILLLGREYWTRIIDFDAMVEEGVIDRSDLDLFHFVETAEEAWQKVKSFYGLS